MVPDRVMLPEAVVQGLGHLLDEPRSAFGAGVQALCARWPHLADCIRIEADAMLAALHATATAHAAVCEPRSHPRIGSFHILSEVGSGGMGTVYLAEQKSPIQRRVALKVIKLGMDTNAVLARFSVERQALALMDHSSIAKVFEAGATPDGRPFFAMEYIRGMPITRYCDDNRLSIEDRLDLFGQVCSGVQHAHQKGVIHRDLTPNNILVTVQEGAATAKIIDFGLARATDRRLSEKTVFTEQGVIMGTPEYMSPEQAGLDVLDIDMRSDVYTLGVLLYELLTGSLPFSREQLRQAGYHKMCEIIRTQEPERPSTKITKARHDTEAVAKLRRSEPEQLLRRLRGDLDWVVLKCLEKDRTRRYATVSELAADVRRHLTHEPVLARAPSFGYRVAKLSRRYRRELVGLAMVFVTLVAGLALATYSWLDADAQAQRADREANAAKVQAGVADAERREATRLAGEALRRQHEFDQLAGVVYLERAQAAEQKLYPPWPHMAPAMRLWLEQDAARLRAMQSEIAATVQSLRQHALPPTSEALTSDRTTHPRYGEWQRMSAKLMSMRRAQEVRAGRPLSLPLPSEAERAMTARQLLNLVWPRVDPDDNKSIWGEEAHALTLALLARDKVDDADAIQRADVCGILAWAWLRNGKDAEALAQSKEAIASMPEPEKETLARLLAPVAVRVQELSGEGGVRAITDLQQQVDAIAADLDTRRTYRFAEESAEFLHDTLRALQGKIEALQANEYPAVQERLAWAERIAALTQAHPAAAFTWAEARAALAKADGIVASELYRGQAIPLRDQDVVGLVPIGMNPATKLWEFYELRSAWDGSRDPATLEIPRHVGGGADEGHIEVGADTGIVFVLLPGGTFTMGAQRADEEAPNYDALALDDETPHQVTVSPFLLARHEMTQGQWKRLTGEEPSQYRAGTWVDRQSLTWASPVDQINWFACARWLPRYGMALPTEAQWEYGCRAGTSTPWWTGAERDSLRGAVNLADQTAATAGVTWSDIADWPDLEDGFVVQAPVDSLRPNPFGLHHVHGNVFEWCADWYTAAYTPPAAGATRRVCRGGSCGQAAALARSAFRGRNAPVALLPFYGVRPARALEGGD